MYMNELNMNAKELTNVLKAFVLSLAEAINYDQLQEATIKRLGVITEDQRAGLDKFFLELEKAEITEADVEDMLTMIDAEHMLQEMLTNGTSDESKEDTAE